MSRNFQGDWTDLCTQKFLIFDLMVVLFYYDDTNLQFYAFIFAFRSADVGSIARRLEGGSKCSLIQCR
jgi:hypothetical protein